MLVYVYVYSILSKCNTKLKEEKDDFMKHETRGFVFVSQCLIDDDNLNIKVSYPLYVLCSNDAVSNPLDLKYFFV